MKSAYAALSRPEENPPEDISELRALEANCAVSYFHSWVGVPIKWGGISRRPIPENWQFHWAAFAALSFGGQSQCSSPGQCNIELCLCRARKRNSDQSHRDRGNGWTKRRRLVG